MLRTLAHAPPAPKVSSVLRACEQRSAKAQAQLNKQREARHVLLFPSAGGDRQQAQEEDAQIQNVISQGAADFEEIQMEERRQDADVAHHQRESEAMAAELQQHMCGNPISEEEAEADLAVDEFAQQCQSRRARLEETMREEGARLREEERLLEVEQEELREEGVSLEGEGEAREAEQALVQQCVVLRAAEDEAIRACEDAAQQKRKALLDSFKAIERELELREPSHKRRAEEVQQL